jgi:hypothetical protein
MIDTPFCNKEDLHEAAKKAGLTPYSLGCSCKDCCKEFSELIRNAPNNKPMVLGLNYLEFGGENYAKTSYAIEQMQACSKESIAMVAKFALQWTGDQELYDAIIEAGVKK